MFFRVYFANCEGYPRPREQVRATPIEGELELRLRSRYGAVLSDPYTGRYQLPVLDQVVIDVRREGVLLTGIEIVPRRSNSKSACDHWPQKWWCNPAGRPARGASPEEQGKDIGKMVRAIGKMQ